MMLSFPRFAGWLLLLAILFGAFPSRAAIPDYRVVSGSGTKKAAHFRAGSEGALLAVGSQITARLDPGTEIRWSPRVRRVYLAPGERYAIRSIRVKSGHLDVTVETSDGDLKEAVMVQYRLGVLAIARGGTVAIDVDGREAAVANVAGLAMVASKSGWRSLAEGTWRRFGPGRRADGPEALLPGPRLQRRSLSFLAFGQKAAIDGLSWHPVPGAARYQVAVERDGEVVRTEVVDSSRAGLGLSLEPGRYSMFVRAIDRHGFAGGRSSPMQLEVAGARLPAGAYTDADGTIRLPKGTTVELSNPGSLEVAYGDGDEWFAAPGRLKALHRSPTTVRVRNRGSNGRGAEIRLAQRAVSAKVVVGPAYAAWPRDDVKIAVRLVTPDGRPPPGLKMRPRVFVGTEPIDVDWERRGDHVTATLPPRNEVGPWVVRVDVRDQFGYRLGYDFLEIAAGGIDRRLFDRIQKCWARSEARANRSAGNRAAKAASPECPPST